MCHRDTRTPLLFIWHYSTTAKLQNPPVTINRWMNWRMWLCIHNRVLFRQRAKLFHFLENGNELEIIILSKIIQIQNDKYHNFLSYVEPMFYVYKYLQIYVHMHGMMQWGHYLGRRMDSLEWGQKKVMETKYDQALWYTWIKCHHESCQFVKWIHSNKNSIK